jgi:hypothetical protein
VDRAARRRWVADYRRIALVATESADRIGPAVAVALSALGLLSSVARKLWELRHPDLDTIIATDVIEVQRELTVATQWSYSSEYVRQSGAMVGELLRRTPELTGEASRPDEIGQISPQLTRMWTTAAASHAMTQPDMLRTRYLRTNERAAGAVSTRRRPPQEAPLEGVGPPVAKQNGAPAGTALHLRSLVQTPTASGLITSHFASTPVLVSARHLYHMSHGESLIDRVIDDCHSLGREDRPV